MLYLGKFIDSQNPIPKAIVAAHMGYNGLNGASLGVLAAISKYGLLEGRGDETRVSDLAIAIIAHPSGSHERVEALIKASTTPELFQEIDSRFQNGLASDVGIRSYLITQKFIPSAADVAIRSYRETKAFIQSERAEYTAPQTNVEIPPASNALAQQAGAPSPTSTMQIHLENENLSEQRKAVFALAEGDVVIFFPENLSAESVEDLSSYLEIFLKKAKREAGISNL